MKRAAAFILILFTLLACSKIEKSRTFTLTGNTGVPEAAVYLHGTDSRYEKVDTAICDDEGFFEFAIAVDTLTPLALITPDGRYVPVYAQPQIKALLKSDSTLRSGWSIEGGRTQALHDSISRILDACKLKKEQYARIDSFIDKNPISLVNIEIIRRYLVDIPSPDNREIRSYTNKLGGILQDHEFFTSLKKKIDRNRSNNTHRTLPTLKFTNAKSEKKSLSDLMGNYILLTFWATWNDESCENVKRLSAIKDSIKSDKFTLVNISLDYDSAAWRKFISHNRIKGENIHDKDMFSSEFLNKFNIKSIPYTMLINPYNRIIEYDVKDNRLQERIDSMTRKHEKELEEKEKLKNKKKNKK